MDPVQREAIARKVTLLRNTLSLLDSIEYGEVRNCGLSFGQIAETHETLSTLEKAISKGLTQ